MNTKSEWSKWAEGLAACARNAGRPDATAADFPYVPPRWDEPEVYCEGRDDTFDPVLSDYLSDRDADAYEKRLGL